MSLILDITPTSTSNYPLRSFIIRGAVVKDWLLEIERLVIDIKDLVIYPIPGNKVNTLWGCLIIPKKEELLNKIDKHELCQERSSGLFLIEKTDIKPILTEDEIIHFFKRKKHLFHPEIGLVELEEPINFEELISNPLNTALTIRKPVEGSYIPTKINTFQIVPLPEEELEKKMLEDFKVEEKPLETKPLSPIEKVKLATYKKMFSKTKNEDGSTSGAIEKKPILNFIDSIFNKKESEEKPSVVDKMEKDFEDLDKRNQKSLDQLLNLLKNNPGEALKYAIPLDEQGTTRGSQETPYDFFKIRDDFSLFNRSNNRVARGSVDLGDGFETLRMQYQRTAEKLKKEKDFKKAAFVYLKLLKSPLIAAQILEEGEFYQEAAMLYLKNGENYTAAALCYEKGNMLTEAIKYYELCDQDEKVGDLYLKLNKSELANQFFEKVIVRCIQTKDYLKAAEVSQLKMLNKSKSQELLLDGWYKGSSPKNCLETYLAGLSTLDDKKSILSRVFDDPMTDLKKDTFLYVLKNEFKEVEELKPYTRELAYRLISERAKSKPHIISELKFFNSPDKELVKDTLKFRSSK